jgi:hypothetical protein
MGDHQQPTPWSNRKPFYAAVHRLVGPVRRSGRHGFSMQLQP